VTYLSAAEVRAQVPALSDAGKFPDELIDALVAEFEGIVERYRGVAFEPRVVTETVRIDRYTERVRLTWPLARDLTGTVNDDPADWVHDGLFVWGPVMSSGDIVSLTYTHGFDAPLLDVLRACRQYVRSSALAEQSSTGRDVISQTADGMTLRYSTPSVKDGRPTGWVEVDRILNTLPDFSLPGIA